MTSKGERAIVAQHHKELHDRLFEIENRFDNAALLVSGGAFTVSAAVLPQFKPPLHASGALVIAWITWAVCLVSCVGGHLLSARCHKRRIELIDKQDFRDEQWQPDFWDRMIAPVNRTTFTALIIGFIAFGIFTFENLDFGGSNGQGKKKGQETSSIDAATQGERRSDSSAGVSAIQEKASDRGELDHGRQAATTDASATGAQAGSREARPPRARSPATGQGEQRTQSPSGIPNQETGNKHEAGGMTTSGAGRRAGAKTSVAGFKRNDVGATLGLGLARALR